MKDEELVADDNWCPDCGHPRYACLCISRIERMTNEELDAELRGYGIDPVELNKRMLARLLEAKARGVDTPRLNEAIRQFTEVTRS